MDERYFDSLERFIRAQESCYAQVVAELKAGAKQGHWIWFIFPQIRELGTSRASLYYGMVDADEVSRYLAHPVLGARYRECVELVHFWIVTKRLAPIEVMSSQIDVMKLRSSLQLFGSVKAGRLEEVPAILAVLENGAK